MKKALIIALVCVPLIIIGIVLLPLGTAKGETVNKMSSKGTGEVNVVPDKAILYLGVVKKDVDVEAAKDEIDKVIDGILSLADKYGIDKKSFKTDFIMIKREYIEKAGNKAFDGYVVSKNFVIILHDVASFDNVFAEAIARGATHIHNVEFKVSNLADLQDRAKDLALEDARRKAEWQAKQLGKKIVKVESITEKAGDVVSWYEQRARWHNLPYKAMLNSNIALERPNDKVARTGQPGIRFAFGRITITANVGVTFALGG